MSVSFYINVVDKATPALRAKIAACQPARLNEFVGSRAVRLTQTHFIGLPHNKRGWTPVNFYEQAADSTHFNEVPGGVLISVSKIGVRQRYQGGVIRPVNAKALAIPMAEEAYGKVPADFGDQLQLVVIKGKGAWLALKSFEQRPKDKALAHGQKGSRNQRQGPALSTLRERLKFLFMLSYGVDQEADPNVLPTDEEYLATATEAIEEAVE